MVSLTGYPASTPILSTSWSRTTLQGAQGPGKTHLETSFPLRCFQRLSLPHIATRQCHWRDNRYTRGGGISLLSPEYLLSVERWPFHTEPPDHFVLLSYLLDLSVSQSSTLMPMHYQHDFRPCLAYLRTPPLRFGRRPPQSNCPPYTVPNPDHGPRLEPQTHQGGISTLAPRHLAAPLQSLPPILHRSVQSPM